MIGTEIFFKDLSLKQEAEKTHVPVFVVRLCSLTAHFCFIVVIFVVEEKKQQILVTI